MNKRMLALENKMLCHEWEHKFGLQRPQKFHVIQADPPFLLFTEEDKRRFWSQVDCFFAANVWLYCG